MDKYGVQYGQQAKTAGTGAGRCPGCGGLLSQEGSPSCPNCGTEPLEAQNGRTNKEGGGSNEGEAG